MSSRLRPKAAVADGMNKPYSGDRPALANTPKPPYYAVIFSSIRNEGDDGYSAMAERMAQLAAASPGFLGMDSARGETGVTVCYWDSLQAIEEWRRNVEHLEAQRKGRERWYSAFQVRIARVEREYGSGSDAGA